ncbi:MULTISPECIES: hypothetical protein [Pseudobutyrivibrio]|uniref:Uncharacterized protein n=1 Tax=Pseudobutyrivibrio xylanivorans TaxID=185007 RepID=A0A1G5S3A0_PSEXY|nr:MULTISPECIES: hypothetical protein [Pseudobutyrivibrio]MDC7279472.1 hypothetical protein [Butyrivibrio fibrisolvens]SCZ80882.1 hypothetical protein SAMN02910350_02523 [Pseudobutyrivibrio xylanivorans]
MKCPCCGNEVCPFNALLKYIVDQESASTKSDYNTENENTKKSQ